MGLREQTRRLLWLDERKANGNAFIALTALTGLVGWGVTVWAVNFVSPIPTGGSLGGPEIGRWASEVMLELKWPVTAVWLVAWFGRFAWGYLRVERGAVVNAPNTVWFGASLVAVGLNLYGVWVSNPELVWLPWMAVFAVGYLSTALLVDRAGVYWVAGVLSTALLAHGVYAVLTDTGYAVLGSAATLPPQLAATVGPNTVLLPLPYTYAILGALQVVPMAIDAALGGRQLTDDGVPAVSANESSDAESLGGVVPSD